MILVFVASATFACGGRRRYVVTVMSRLIRLSYYDRVRQAVPESFRPLLPPPPAAEELPPAAAAAEGKAGAFAGGSPEEVQTAAASQLLAKVPPWHSLALPAP